MDIKPETSFKDTEKEENEVKNIIKRNPMEELKLIKEKIKKENEKINEIDSKLEKIKNNKNIPKRNLELDDFLNNIIKNQNNIISHKITNQKNINISKSLDIASTNGNHKTENSTNTRKEKKEKLIIDINYLIEKERLEKQKIYDNKIKIFHYKQLEREKKRKELIEQINKVTNTQKNAYPSKKYYYLSAIEKEEIKKQKEELFLKIEKEKRKQKYLPISSEELKKFSKEVMKNEKNLEIEIEHKKQQMEQIWKERKNLLPKYQSKFLELNKEYDKEAKEELKLKIEKLRNKEIERANFGKEIIKSYLPKKLSDKLKKEREQRIKELNGQNRFNIIKELGHKLKEKSKKVVLSQQKNFSKKNKFIVEETVKEQQAKKLTGKPVDYLSEQRNKVNNDNKLKLGGLVNDNSLKNIKKWNKMLEGQGNNVVNNIEKIKLEAELMNDKAENINQLIKLESLKNPNKDELKKEASNYYINSINAKLQVLNKLISKDS